MSDEIPPENAAIDDDDLPKTFEDWVSGKGKIPAEREPFDNWIARIKPEITDPVKPVEQAVQKVAPIATPTKRALDRIVLGSLLSEIYTLVVPGYSTPTEVIEDRQILDRAAALPAAYETEICKAICSHFELHPADANGYRTTIRDRRKQAERAAELGIEPVERKKKVKTAEREDYFQLYESTLGPLRRDIFSGLLLHQGREGFWVPAIDGLQIVKSNAGESKNNEICNYEYQMLEPNFLFYENQKTPELIADVPLWDGLDRIAQIAEACVLDESQQGFCAWTLDQFLKDWLASVFHRIDDPNHQNRMLIFKGPQGIGKDYLIDVLTGGFGQWSRHLTITRNEADNLLQLSNAAVLKIAEFDRTASTDTSLLKHMVTAESTDVRSPYAREAKRRVCRCSFIASCNVNDIFRDPTGNRRYIVICLDTIVRGYPASHDDRLQILAQGRSLYEQRFTAHVDAETALAAYLQEKRPTAVEDDIVDTWHEVVEAFMRSPEYPGEKLDMQHRGWIYNSEIAEYKLMEKVAKQASCNERYCRQKLRLMGLEKRTKSRKGYRFQLFAENTDSYEIE